MAPSLAAMITRRINRGSLFSGVVIIVTHPSALHRATLFLYARTVPEKVAPNLSGHDID
jgi:hypothetical protein